MTYQHQPQQLYSNTPIFLMNRRSPAIYIAIIVLIAAYNIETAADHEKTNNELLIETIHAFTDIPLKARQRAIQFVQHLPITIEGADHLLDYARGLKTPLPPKMIYNTRQQ